MFVNSDSAHTATVNVGTRDRGDRGDPGGNLSTFTYKAATPQVVSGTTNVRQIRSGIELAPDECGWRKRGTLGCSSRSHASRSSAAAAPAATGSCRIVVSG